MKIKIDRLKNEHTDKQVTGRGYLLDGDKVVYTFFTLELPWKDNKVKVSCIKPSPKDSAMTYKLKTVSNSPSFKYKHFDILGTEGRTAVKIHAGNYHTQILGCVLVGTGLTDINNDKQKDVTSSRVCLDKILELSNGDVDELIIGWV
jgi:hypothetical protein